ncbi:MAG: PQQ-like beta-propeller repeat protein, partial [Planctomycetes bacterium]|nr:PQQ-like beta-propeller repeat protein [Planctomycetota bacterium]
KLITPDDTEEADTVWVYDMMRDLGISQHNMCACSVTQGNGILFVATGNGVDETHINIPAPNAPSFFAMDRNTGKVLWTDKSPGLNILHGQWSSPTYAVLGGVPQVLFAGGDGWLYSFRADQGTDGKPELLWKFDCNPKESKWTLGGRGTRNNVIATPVVYDGLVYLAVGQDPEHGEGIGHLWCIDPTKRGDVSPELVFNKDEGDKPIPHRRYKAVVKELGDFTKPNPNSAAVWHYSGHDANGDGDSDLADWGEFQNGFTGPL